MTHGAEKRVAVAQHICHVGSAKAMGMAVKTEKGFQFISAQFRGHVSLPVGVFEPAAHKVVGLIIVEVTGRKGHR